MQTTNSTQGTTVAFTYDAWGRMVTKTQGNHLAAYRFRFGDKMTQIDSNFPDEAALVTMMYDGLGKRRHKFVSGTPNSTTYWWRWGGVGTWSTNTPTSRARGTGIPRA